MVNIIVSYTIAVIGAVSSLKMYSHCCCWVVLFYFNNGTLNVL